MYPILLQLNFKLLINSIEGSLLKMVERIIFFCKQVLVGINDFSMQKKATIRTMNCSFFC